MSEIVDDILDGRICQYCGQYFIDPVGYPITCQSCIEDGFEQLTPQDIREAKNNAATRTTKRRDGRDRSDG